MGFYDEQNCISCRKYEEEIKVLKEEIERLTPMPIFEKVPCIQCGGAGYYYSGGDNLVRCSNCYGLGTVYVPYERSGE